MVMTDVFGCWLLVVGCWLGFREVLDTFCLSSFHFERQNTRTDVVVWLLVVGFWCLVVGFWVTNWRKRCLDLWCFGNGCSLLGFLRSPKRIGRVDLGFG